MDLKDDNIFISGPSFHVDLSALDALHPVHYVRRLLIFRCTSTAQRQAQLSAFQEGIQALVNRCPILGGLVVPLPDDETGDGKSDWRTIVPDRGIELIVRDLRSHLPSFEELERDHFPPSKLLYDPLVPIPPDLGNERPFPACKMQYSAIEGGTILTYATSHSVADGTGTNELMRILSDGMRLAQAKPHTDGTNPSTKDARAAAVGLDRSKMRDMTSDVPFNIKDHPGFIEFLPQSPTSTTNTLEATSPEIPVLLRIPPAKLAQLKADATTPDAPPISTHDALCALIWRTLLLIRSRRATQAGMPMSEIDSMQGNFYMPSDGRRYVGLTDSYVGNAVYQLTAALPIGELTSSTAGLQKAASAVRRSILSVNPVHVASYIAQTRNKWVHWRFLTDYPTTGVAMGTDWTSGGLYQHDYGEAFGPLRSFRYPGNPFNCIFPKLLDGGAEVLVGVMPEEMEQLHSADAFGNYVAVN